MKHKLKWDEIIGIFFMLISVILLGISVFLCFSSDIWYDELFTMGLADQPFGKLISITARDVHPPLYYMIVKLFQIVFGSIMGGIHLVVIAKLVSALPFFFCILYAATKVRKHFGMLAAGIFSFLLLSMPQMADYTVEIRMYGYAVFFVMAGMLHAYEVIHEKRKKNYANWIALTFYSLAACYTHYFACVAACMVYLYLFFSFWREHNLKRNVKLFFLSGLFCTAGYLPWITAVVTKQVGQIKDNYWIQPLSWRSLGGCIKFLFQPFFNDERLNAALAVLLFLCYGGLLTLLFVKWMRKGQEEEREKAFFVLGCVAVLVGIVLFGFLASFLIRPIFVYRYMLPALGVFWLAFAVLISEVKAKKYIYIPILLCLLVIGLRNYRSFYGEEMWKRVQMDKAKEALLEIEEEDVLVFNFDQTQAVVSYYLPNQTFLWYGEPEILICEMYPQNHELVENEFSDEEGILALKKLLKKGNQVWFLGSGNAREEILEKWENAGIEAEECASIMVERYWFNLYKIENYGK